MASQIRSRRVPAPATRAATDLSLIKTPMIDAGCMTRKMHCAILTHPLLKDSADAITINLIDNGMQVILVDQAGAPMFDLGAVEPNARAQILLREIAAILNPLPNRIVIECHADATGAGSYSSFDLTAARQRRTALS